MTAHGSLLRLVLFLITLLVCLAGCGSGSGGDSVTTPNAPAAQPAPIPESPFGLSARASLGALTLPGSSATAPGSFALERRFSDLSLVVPLFLAPVPGEDQLVVAQQNGRVVAFSPAGTGLDAEVILDLSGQTLFAGEQGLLGFAFDPDFTSNRFIYVHYSRDSPRRSVISRFTWFSGGKVDLNSERVLISQAQPFSNHNGGMLAFGPDDFLYIAFGDGGSGGDPQDNAQNPENFLGSLLRIDVHPADTSQAYSAPSDNPFVGQSGIAPETWAYGLRNPFRFSFDRQTGDLWLGDVGQATLEEINLIDRGGNYGWRLFEGTNSFDPSGRTVPANETIFPIHEFGRDEGVSVIGGYLYRGNNLPSLRGRYVYGDFGSGNIWALSLEGELKVANDVIASVSNPTSFGEDASGEIFVLTASGTVHALIETVSSDDNTADLLSATGIFTSLGILQVAEGFIEYEVNHPFWSDGTSKRRWLAIPNGTQITFDATGAWNFPSGTVIVKHFELQESSGVPRRLETRLLINADNGWQGFTYRWNEAQTDAELISGRTVTTLQIKAADGSIVEQTYTYPGSADCRRCHTAVAGSILGVKTGQLNRDFAYPEATDNQLRTLNHIGLFDRDIGDVAAFSAIPAPDDAAQSVSQRARAYLDVNCAQCHQPGGPTAVDMDLRFTTPLADTALLNALPTAGDLGVSGAMRLLPGERMRSVLWLRMETIGAERMPPLSSHRVDEFGLELIGQWIDESP